MPQLSVETYKYLFIPKNDQKCDISTEVMEARYPSIESLGGRFIARNSLENKYYVFADMNAFESYMQGVDENRRCFHEVIIGKRPQRIKFDIDATASLLNECYKQAANNDPDGFLEKSQQKTFNDSFLEKTPSDDEMIKVVLEEIDAAICDSFYVAWQKSITPEDILTTTSTAFDAKSGEIKYSYHKIIKGYYAESNIEVANYISEYFAKFLRPDFHELIDFYVYKTIQNFRIVYNHKENSTRVKLPMLTEPMSDSSPTTKFIPYLVQNITECELLPRKSRKQSAENDWFASNCGDYGRLTNEDIQKTLKLATNHGLLISSDFQHASGGVGNGTDADHILNKINGGLLTFHRLRPSVCDICRRKHDNENSLMISVITSSFGDAFLEKRQEKGDGGVEKSDSGEEEDSAPSPQYMISRVYMLCRRNKAAKIFLGSFEPELGCEMKEVMSSSANNELYSVVGATAAPPPKITKKFVQEKVLDAIVFTHNAIQTESLHHRSGGATLPQDQSKFSSLPLAQRNIYSDKGLRDFEYVDTLCVRAGMKMGKTKKLVEYVEKYYADTDYYTNNIILVSFRQTFSKEVQNKFKGFVLYNEITGEINNSRVIIQVESLHRIGIGAGKHKPDLLILDECESIFDQFDSGLHKKFAESWAVFKWLMANSSHLICMDANLSNRTYEIITRMRTRSDIWYHFNTYKNALSDTYHLTVSKNEWYLDLYNSLANGKKIAVAMSSLTEAKVLYEGVTAKFPSLRIGFYSSKTPMSEKRLHFSNVDEYWGCYDVLIYTPTVSAGISFEKAHYDKMYAYFTDNSCHAEICIQMLGRIRNVKSGSYIVYIDSTRRNLPTSMQSIRESLMDSRSNLFKNIGDAPLTFEYDAKGRVKFYENDYFYVWLENTRIKNLSRNNFIQRFIQLISPVGPTITKLKIIADVNDLQGIEMENTGIKTQLKDKEAAMIANAPELTDVEIIAVVNKFTDRDAGDDNNGAASDLTDAERYGYEKFRLRRDYQWGGKIDVEFVKNYNNSRNRRVFKNLVRISGSQLAVQSSPNGKPLPDAKPLTITEALAQIQADEKINYEIALDSEEKYLQDVKRKYVFDQHWIAVEMLRICGVSSLRDTSWISQYDLKIAFKEHEKKIYNELIKHYELFGMKKPHPSTFTYSDGKNTRDYVNGILGHINKILLSMYGIKIASNRSDPDLYKLCLNKQFELMNITGDSINTADKKVPCVYSKWRPPSGTSDNIEIQLKTPYGFLDEGSIVDLPMHLKDKLGFV